MSVTSKDGSSIIHRLGAPLPKILVRFTFRVWRFSSSFGLVRAADDFVVKFLAHFTTSGALRSSKILANFFGALLSLLGRYGRIEATFPPPPPLLASSAEWKGERRKWRTCKSFCFYFPSFVSKKKIWELGMGKLIYVGRLRKMR